MYKWHNGRNCSTWKIGQLEIWKINRKISFKFYALEFFFYVSLFSSNMKCVMIILNDSSVLSTFLRKIIHLKKNNIYNSKTRLELMKKQSEKMVVQKSKQIQLLRSRSIKRMHHFTCVLIVLNVAKKVLILRWVYSMRAPLLVYNYRLQFVLPLLICSEPITIHSTLYNLIPVKNRKLQNWFTHEN